MKKNITDPAQLELFREKVLAWLKSLAGSRSAGFNPEITVSGASEHSAYKASYEAEIESRAVVKVSKYDAVKLPPQPAVLLETQVDPWAAQTEPPESFGSFKKTVDVIESLKAAPCRQCNGTGKMNCPECMGQKGIYCKECRGSGKAKCPECRGAKTVKCEQCGGTGQLEGGVGACPRCGGRKEHKCPTCEGTASIKCPACGGKMRLPCVKCGETGLVQCSFCAGAGQNVSGFGVEISYDVTRAVSENTDAEIPPEIAGDRAAGGWVKETELSSPELKEELKKKAFVPERAKVLFDRFSSERKTFYRVQYTISGVEKEAWFAGPDPASAKPVGRDNPLLNMYSGVIDDIKKHLSSGDMNAAHEHLSKIEGIDSLKGEAAKYRTAVDKVLYFSYMAGAAGAFCALTAVSAVITLNGLRGSFHSGIVVFGSVMVNAAAAWAGGLAAFKFNYKRLDNYWKRLGGGAAAAAVLIAVCYSAFIAAGFDLAKRLDTGMMKKEYEAHFPFGMRTLASEDDIRFLEGLVAKYGPARVDLSQVKQDLEFMRNKLAADRKALAEAEIMRQKIEQADKAKKSSRKTYRPERTRKKKIYIK